MGSQLFSWILAAGLFSMFWFLYRSIRQDNIRNMVAQSIRRHGRPLRRNGTIANP